MGSPKFKVIVSSCDGFSDTWEPFFKMYAANMAGLDAELLLITEKKEYSYPGLDIKCTRANREREGRLTWGECIHDALDQADSELILYLQDDYFIEEPADVEMIKEFAQKMIDQPEIKCIGLTHYGAYGRYRPTEDKRLGRVGRRARYRINIQAALWRSDCLREYFRVDENGWMCEVFGTRRSWRRNEEFLMIRRDLPPPIFYTFTGIIKGRWHRAMPALFARYGLEMDFSKRGFYDPPPAPIRKWQTFQLLLSSPDRLWKGLRGY